MVACLRPGGTEQPGDWRMSDEKQQSNSDVGDVMAEERSRRGDRPWLDTEARREERKLHAGYLKIIAGKDEKKFREALIALGWKPGSAEFEDFVRVWRSIRR